VIQESLKKLNVDVTVTQMEWGAFVADNKKSNDSCGREGTDIYSSANTFRPDPDGYLYPYFHSKGEINKGGCDTPDLKLDGLLVEARQRATTRAREAAYEEIQRHAMQESSTGGGTRSTNIEAVSSKLRATPVVHRPPALPQEGLARRYSGGSAPALLHRRTPAVAGRRGALPAGGRPAIRRTLIADALSGTPRGLDRPRRFGVSVLIFFPVRLLPATSSTSSRGPKDSWARRSARRCSGSSASTSRFLSSTCGGSGACFRGNSAGRSAPASRSRPSSPRGCRSRSSSPFSRC
jgi:hypothetical protein